MTTGTAAFSLDGKRVWVAGHRGMAGSAVVRRLEREPCEILTVGREAVDLRRQADVEAWMAEARPDVVFLTAALVGGIHANNTRPAEFLYENLAIETNIIHAAKQVGVQKLVFLGSSCIYPRMAPQPIVEEALLTGPLEPTNEWYAIAKIAGIKMCQAYRRQYGCDFISAMPTNLYGYGDNFDIQQGHVAAALMVKIHRAKTEGAASVELWGDGSPLREFLFVEDLADGLVFLAKNYSGEPHVNLGSGQEVSIRGLAELLADVIGFKGDFRFDPSKPNGTPRKIMDNGRIAAMGWTAPTPLRDGFEQTYRWYLEKQGTGTLRGLPAAG
ncbi:NAD-dependent epimerase/dehydratase family protein [Azospirillum formosense]|uniref:GDP-L-fucose synthase n=1 Tax=Azospirillum formosense TaxID=861533 RepID=A0ABX2KSI5_9PROT|nr:GDP-L-fucose synthase [Azospirillum formosense]MBY3757553.1 GDP-L-fucose synthase [Azospirillum formosense]MBY3757679.1 GDP-L-fucose synthase [Azospirillum formosense]NUB19536.1 NAD-dependent epimerase/dehydratase family protein [Azospirillum formosense]